MSWGWCLLMWAELGGLVCEVRPGPVPSGGQGYVQMWLWTQGLKAAYLLVCGAILDASLAHQWVDTSPRTTTPSQLLCQDPTNTPAGVHQPQGPPEPWLVAWPEASQDWCQLAGGWIQVLGLIS